MRLAGSVAFSSSASRWRRPPGARATSRIARPDPNRLSSLPNVTGPSPWIEARTVHASRSAARAVGRADARVSLGALRPSERARTGLMRTGPSRATPSTSARQACRGLAGRRSVAGGLLEARDVHGLEIGQVCDGSGNPEQPLRAARRQPLQLRQGDQPALLCSAHAGGTAKRTSPDACVETPTPFDLETPAGSDP